MKKTLYSWTVGVKGFSFSSTGSADLSLIFSPFGMFFPSTAQTETDMHERGRGDLMWRKWFKRRKRQRGSTHDWSKPAKPGEKGKKSPDLSENDTQSTQERSASPEAKPPWQNQEREDGGEKPARTQEQAGEKGQQGQRKSQDSNRRSSPALGVKANGQAGKSEKNSSRQGNRGASGEAQKSKQVTIPSTWEDLTVPVYRSVQQNQDVMRDLFGDCYDVTFRSFHMGSGVKAEIVYIDNMTNVDRLNDNVLTPLQKDKEAVPASVEEFSDHLPVSDVKPLQTFAECVDQLTLGKPILFVDGLDRALCLGLDKREKRAIADPENEPAIRGPKEGFIESLGVNTALLRTRLRVASLRLQKINVGRYSNTRVVIAHIEGVANPDIVAEVKRRLKRIDVDAVTGYLEEFIEDNPYSPFPQIQTTERVDAVVGALLEGRVAIIVDGTPTVFIVPLTLPIMLQATEDYYNRAFAATMMRWLRYLLFFLSLALPSFYVATITFHPETVPTDQLISFAGARERIPLPTLVEALLMETAFEALREAGLRLPKIVGPAVSIVGALVIGEAAVTAGLVSAPMVIVVASTGIASFTVPRYAAGLSIRFLRFPLLILSGTLGMVGLIWGLIAIAVHLSSLRSFGVSYLAPVAPTYPGDLKDVFVRMPWWKFTKRPQFTGTPNIHRQAGQQKPGPEQGGEE
jgi:spore germination protein KA